MKLHSSNRFLLSLAVFCIVPASVQAQNLFISGYRSHTVEEYTPTGALVGTFISANSGGLNLAQNLRFGPDGNLYVTDTSDVKKYDGTTGVYLGDFATGLSGAVDIIFDTSGNAYVAEYSADRVSKYSSGGTLLQTFTSGVSTPEGLAFAADGDLLVSNAYSGAYRNTISKVNTTSSTFTTFATGLGEPVGITAGPDGRYYVGNYTFANGYGGTNPDTIQVVGANGGVSQTWNSGGSLGGTSYLAFSEGDLFVTSYYNDLTFRFDGTTGAFLNSFSSPSGVSGIAVRPVASSPVPEPGSLALLVGMGVSRVCLLHRRKKRTQVPATFLM